MWIDEFLKCGAIISTGQGKVLLGWGKRTWLKEPKVSDFVSFFFPDFFLTAPRPWFIHEFSKELHIAELSEVMRGIKCPAAPAIFWRNAQKELFVEGFRCLQDRFSQGSLFKGVPYGFETAKTEMTRDWLPISLLNLLQIVKRYPLFIYGFWDQNEGMLGGTPELLLHVTYNGGNTKATSVACAGTSSKEGAPGLSKDSKQLHEHDLVVEGVCKSLSDFGPVKKMKIQTIEFQTLCHLVTPIEVSIEGHVSFSTILRAIHPTAALGAYPKVEGMTWLKEYQTKIPRHRYGAPAGFYSPRVKEFKCYVAIRNVQWDKGEMKIGAGCGIVPQSKLDLEWEEFLLKIKSIKELLAL